MRSVLFSSVQEFAKCCTSYGTDVLYVHEDSRGGRGESKKIRAYFVSNGLVHDLSQTVCSGENVTVDSVEVDEQSFLIWIRGERTKGENNKTRAYTKEALSAYRELFTKFIEDSNEAWNTFEDLLGTVKTVVYIQNIQSVRGAL